MRRILAAGSLLVSAACATTGATFRSGVGDRFLEHPPYYAGDAAFGGANAVALLPVHYQQGASQPPFLDPGGGKGSATAALLADMNAWLDSMKLTGAMLPAATTRGTGPDVHFGCEQNAGDDCEERDETVLGRRGTTMRLAVGRPSPEWITSLAPSLAAAGASHALLITLEVGQYWTRQTGLRGNKSVELGTGNTMSLPWLTSLEAPVSVLQLTGVVVDREGKAVRIGVEGILARRTTLVGSAVGLQRILRDEDVEQARTMRRDDLAGNPLAWQVALRHLVTQLTKPASAAAGIPE